MEVIDTPPPPSQRRIKIPNDSTFQPDIILNTKPNDLVPSSAPKDSGTRTDTDGLPDDLNPETASEVEPKAIVDLTPKSQDCSTEHTTSRETRSHSNQTSAPFTLEQYRRFLIIKSYFDAHGQHLSSNLASRQIHDDWGDRDLDCGCESAFGTDDDGEVLHWDIDCPYQE